MTRPSRFAPEFKARAIDLYRTSEGRTIADVARELGIGTETFRKWVVTPDDLLDQHICEPMADETVGLDEPYTLPDARQVMVPQEAHPQCRCSEVLVTKD